MRRPSTPFLILSGIMILLFIVGLILIGVLASRNSNPNSLELTATAVFSNGTIELYHQPTFAASTPTAQSPY